MHGLRILKIFNYKNWLLDWYDVIKLSQKMSYNKIDHRIFWVEHLQ